MEHPEKQADISLPVKQRNLVQLGCICLMLSTAMYGFVFSTLTRPILDQAGAPEYVSLFSIFASLGISIMTPIGGKLGDLIGQRRIVVTAGLLCAVCGIAFAFVHTLIPLLILRLLISFAQGAFTAAPYIIAGRIHRPSETPRAMGLLAAAVAVGGFGGSILAGILMDLNLLPVAILMPALPLLAGVVLIGRYLPNRRRENIAAPDLPGTLTLAVALCGLLLALDFGPSVGWIHPGVLTGFAVGTAALFLLYHIEQHAQEPLIPLELFSNRTYSFLLLLSFLCCFYQSAMTVYAPIGVQAVLGASTTTAGAMLLPRTLITALLPVAAGTWLSRGDSWKAMAIAAAVTAIAMALLAFSRPGLPVLTYYAALGLTGVAESFRSVSILPAIQSTLPPQDMGVGTALLAFCNSLSGTIAAAVFGVAYNLRTAPNPLAVLRIQSGVNTVFWLAAAVSAVGLVLVLRVLRPRLARQ